MTRQNSVGLRPDTVVPQTSKSIPSVSLRPLRYFQSLLQRDRADEI